MRHHTLLARNLYIDTQIPTSSEANLDAIIFFCVVYVLCKESQKPKG